MIDQVVAPIAHVPGVFSHYAPLTGSALITKVYEHARALERAGGRAYVLVNAAREVGYDAGTVIRFSSPREGQREHLSALERRLDRAVGLATGRHPVQQRFWRPAVNAVPRDARAVVVYNQPSALSAVPDMNGDCVRVLHLGNDVFRGWRRRHVARAVASHDLVVAVSQFTADTINALLPRGVRPVEVLRNGVDVERFRPGPQGTTGQPPEILFVGNVVPHKGAHHLLKAATALARRGVDFQVRVVGSWGLSRWEKLTSYEEELRSIAAPLGRRAIFQPFTGREAIADVYRRAALFCMPVDWDEPAGQVVTEAMASGLPVVAARRGGIPEYLGPDGVYADPGDTPALADSLQRLLEDDVLRSTIGASLRRRALGMTWDHRVRQFDQLLRGGTGGD